MHKYTCIYLHIHVHVHVYTYTHIYVCTYIYVCTCIVFVAFIHAMKVALYKDVYLKFAQMVKLGDRSIMYLWLICT